MNDTEAEARRLLAAATEDMPPGIDLLDGFAAAQRRDQAGRRRGRVVLAAGAAVAAAVGTAVALTIGSAPPALATVTSALTRTLAQSYHLTETSGVYYIRSGRITNRSQLTCTSEADPVRQLEASSCPNGLRNREVGRYIYFFFTALAGHPGKHWQRFPAASPDDSGAVDGFVTATPQQMLSQIKKADKVTVIGPVSGPGWMGTRYAFASSQAAGLSGTVDVDRQGRARALVLTIRQTGKGDVVVMTQVLTFSDFGATVMVTPPPADQTVPEP